MARSGPPGPAAQGEPSVASVRGTSQGRRRRSRLGRRSGSAFIFLLPALTIYTTFVVAPLVRSLWGSLFRWRGFRSSDFIGLANFDRLFTGQSGRLLMGAFTHNVMWFFGNTVLQTGLGLILAYCLFLRGKRSVALESLFFFPTVLSPVIVGALWRLLLAPGGATDVALHRLGLIQGPLIVLGDSRFALWALIGVDTWNWMGLPVLIFLAGLRQIPAEMIEAARLEGARPGRLLWSVALPQLVPSLASLTILSFINTFNQFDMVYVMEGVGGSPNYATDTLVTYFYRLAFGAVGSVGITDIGLALALGSLLFLVLSTVTLGMLYGFGRLTARLA